MFRYTRQCARLVEAASKAVTVTPRNISSSVLGFSGRSALEVSCKAVGLGPSSHGSIPSVRRYSTAKPALTKEAIQDRVLKICKNFDKITADKLTLEANFMSDLGLDSLDHVELVMALEDEFGYEVSDTDAEKLLRPADIVKYVLAKQTAAPADAW